MLLRELGGDGEGAAVPHDLLINNSIVDLCGKCGAVELARQVVDRMPAWDLASWNVMILKLANRGFVRESVEMFDRMTRVEKVVPNTITFVAVLSACNLGGLVEEGRRYFEMVVGKDGIKPRIEGYGRMVDILARAGFIEEALDVVSGMNCRLDAIIWRSLLDACCKRNAGLELSESMAKLALDVPDDAVRLAGYMFGLLNAMPGAPIWTLKNLRLCKGCRTISKLVSKLYGVEIIVKDRTQFHRED